VIWEGCPCSGPLWRFGDPTATASSGRAQALAVGPKTSSFPRVQGYKSRLWTPLLGESMRRAHRQSGKRRDRGRIPPDPDAEVATSPLVRPDPLAKVGISHLPYWNAIAAQSTGIVRGARLCATRFGVESDE